jgi:endoribonuclease Dicer
VFQDVFSKSFDATAGEMPYFLAPVTEGHDYPYSQMDKPPVDLIDWEALQVVKDYEKLEFDEDNDDPEEFFKDRFVVDPFDGARKLYTVRVRKDLKPLDPVPEGVPDPTFRGWKALEHNIQEYSISMWSRARALRTWKQDQPVAEAQIVSLRQNLLDDLVGDEVEKPKTCFVILEPLAMSSVSTESKMQENTLGHMDR